MKKKRIFIKSKDISNKIGNYIEKNGFYLVIFLCIVIIGATITVVSIRDYKKMEMRYALDNQPVEKNIQNNDETINDKVYLDKSETLSQTIEKYEVTEVPKKEQVKNKIITEKENTQEEQKKEESNKTEDIKNKSNNINKNKIELQKSIELENEPVQKEEEKIELNYPVYGKIINPYAQDKLIYSKTLQQWTTHTGIDISSDKGTPVKCAMEGIIKSIKNDPRYGITIIIEHNGGVKTVYSNLSSANMVKTNQEVKRETVISGVGDTANFECEDPSHLHFEVIIDGKNVDPMDYLSVIE